MIGVRLLFLPDSIVGGAERQAQVKSEASANEGHVTKVIKTLHRREKEERGRR
jgi:hypothetical protein